MLQNWLYIIIGIFLISISIITYSIISNFIFYYKNEIYITRLVGWWKLFIYWPFSLQWIIYTFVSSILSFVIFIIVIKNINLVFWDLYNFSWLLSTLYYVFLMELLIFMFIGWFSWFMSSRKYLK
jgi:cell division protein FtsX